MDHGAPRSFRDADMGLDVISSDGERVGTLENVLADVATNIFDGIVIDVSRGPGGHRFVDAPEVDAFFERAVVLKVTAAAVEQLPEPSANPAVVRHGGAEDSVHPMRNKLQRAWDRLTGRY